VTKNTEDSLSEIDEFDFAYGPDFDVELFDDTPIDTIDNASARVSAWQRIESREESRRLREQLMDWDEYLEIH
jgi:hypothetical protein